MPLVAAAIVASLAACPLTLPADGPVVAGFAPQGRYAGHWGVDVSVPSGTPVRAPADGAVTFAGSVAGMRTVTIDHGGFRSSVSYLAAVLVAPGRDVHRGDVIGLAGRPHGRPGVHLSVREGDVYADPERHLSCGGAGGGTVRLLPPDRTYAARRE